MRMETAEAAVGVLKAFGLPDYCRVFPVKWTGTREQQFALHLLHREICTMLPLPGHNVDLPEFEYNPEGVKQHDS